MPDPIPAPSSRPDSREHAETVRKTLRANGVMRYGQYERKNTLPALAALSALLAEIERLEGERDEARESNAVFMSGEAYSRLHEAWHNEQDRAEAAEALAEQLLAVARDYERLMRNSGMLAMARSIKLKIDAALAVGGQGDSAP